MDWADDGDTTDWIESLDEVEPRERSERTHDQRLHHLERKVDRIMAQIDDLNTQLDTLQTTVTRVGTDVQTELDALQTKVSSLGVAPQDLSAAIDRLRQINGQLLAVGAERPTPAAAPQIPPGSASASAAPFTVPNTANTDSSAGPAADPATPPNDSTPPAP